MNKFRYDYILLAVILLLTMLGLVTLYSASYLFALNQPGRFKSGLAPLWGNLRACAAMLVFFPIIMLMRMDRLKNGRIIIGLIVLTILLNLLPVFQPLWRSSHRPAIDAKRWIVIGGISFQPSELIKIVLPLYLAYIMDKNKERLNSFLYGPLPPAIITIVFCGLVLWQSNFSEALFIALTSVIICLMGGIRLRWFALAGGIFIPAVYFLVSANKDGRWYQRLMSFFSKEFGYQISMSIDAVQSGGFWGKGIGQGTLKIRMPEVHGDFVFASYAEESGFLGVLFYLALIGIFAWLGYLSAWKSRDRFFMILTFGLVTGIVIQSLLNIAVVVRLIPTTGIPLPFVSSGGSSLIGTLTAAALLVNMTRLTVNSGNMGGENVG